MSDWVKTVSMVCLVLGPSTFDMAEVRQKMARCLMYSRKIVSILKTWLNTFLLSTFLLCIYLANSPVCPYYVLAWGQATVWFGRIWCVYFIYAFEYIYMPV